MNQGRIAGRGECQVTEHGGNAKLVGAKHKTNANGNKPAEGGLPGETGFKLTQDFTKKFSIIVW